MDSERTSFVIRLLRGTAELGAGFWTSLAAGTAQSGYAELAAGAASCAALFIGAKTALGARQEKEAQQRVERRLRAHLADTKDLRKAVTALAAEHDMHEWVSRARADKLLALLDAQEEQLDELIAGDDDLREGLRNLDDWLSKWCARQDEAHERIEQLLRKLAAGAQARAMESLHQLRPPVGDFTGRADEIDELLEKLQSGGVTITGVHGLGGIGKTELALVLAERLKERYPDAQIYLDLRGTEETPTSAADALRHVILSFQPEAKLPDDVPKLQGLYNSALHDKRVLLLMDNAAEAEQLLPLTPPPKGCVLLVTSRQQFTLPGLYVKNLDTLSPEHARSLLLRICPRIGDAAERIAKLCFRLPLALRAAASLLDVQADLSVPVYIEDLTAEHTRLETIGTEGVPISVEATLHQSYRRLDDDLARVFRLLSVFPSTFDGTAAEFVTEDALRARAIRVSTTQTDTLNGPPSEHYTALLVEAYRCSKH